MKKIIIILLLLAGSIAIDVFDIYSKIHMEESENYHAKMMREYIPCIQNSNSITLANIEESLIFTEKYDFTDEEIYILAQLLCGDGKCDGDGEYDFDFKEKPCEQEINKVLSVVMNRQKDDRYPDTIKEIVLEENQFHVFPRNIQTVPSEKALLFVEEWCNGYAKDTNKTNVIPDNHIFFYSNGKINITFGRE